MGIAPTCPGHDALRGEVQRLLTRPALAVDGDTGHRLGVASREESPVGGVAGLLANLADCAADHVVDAGGVDPGPLD